MNLLLIGGFIVPDRAMSFLYDQPIGTDSVYFSARLRSADLIHGFDTSPIASVHRL